MFIETLYNFIIFLKNQGQSRWFSVEEVMDALNWAQQDKYRTEMKTFEKDKMVTDALGPFKTNIVIKRGDGFVFPSNYRHWTLFGARELGSGGSLVKEHEMKVKTDAEWLNAVNSALLPPSMGYAVCRVVGKKIEAKPDSVTEVNMYYLKNPITAVYAYDIVDGVVTFKTAGSVDVEWNITDQADLIKRTVSYLGIPLRDELLAQIEQIVNQPTGN